MCYSDDRFIKGILSTEIDAVWNEVAPMLERAIASDEYRLQDVFDELLRAEMQLWVALNKGKIEAVLTTRITIYPQSKAIVLVHMAGQWDQGLTQYLEHIAAWGKSNEATKMVIYGRQGWEKLLKDIFMKRAIVLEMAL